MVASSKGSKVPKCLRCKVSAFGFLGRCLALGYLDPLGAGVLPSSLNWKFLDGSLQQLSNCTVRQEVGLW